MSDEEFGDLFALAGCRGWLCVVEVDGDGEVSLGGDQMVVAASVFKVAVALEVFTQANDGRLDPRERVRIRQQGARPDRRGSPSLLTRSRFPFVTWSQ